MVKKPRLSLIITVYNKAPFLMRCLDSVMRQKTDDLQVIVIDDASTDNSWDIMFGCMDCLRIQNPKNEGVSATRNFGIEMADADAIAFLDADDALRDGAVETMLAYAEHLEKHPIIQYGQERVQSNGMRTMPALITKGTYTVEKLPKYWQMVWNKIYSKKLILEHSVAFREDMRFGEDEMFNIDLLSETGELWQAPHTLVCHYMDDRSSICRGGTLSNVDCQKLDKAIGEKIKSTNKVEIRNWLTKRRAYLRTSKIYKDAGFSMESSGKYDIVYMLKESPVNEELRYSLRSVDENMPYKRVWFAGGKPNGIEPDCYMKLKQDAPSKWQNVRNMLVEICKNDDITEDFWLFNDDFFILRPFDEDTPQFYYGTLREQIERCSRKGGRYDYVRRLEHLVETLEQDGLPTLNYSVHKPILVNRKRALEVLEKYPDEPMFRALYGNYWNIRGIDEVDCKIRRLDKQFKNDRKMVSTQDDSFKQGLVGRQIRDRFKYKSRFEV